MYKVLFVCWLLLSNVPVTGQVFQQKLPLFYPVLKAEQIFSAAWQGNPEQDILKWREDARKIYRDALLWPPQDNAYDAKLIAVEKREGYQAELWQLTLTQGNRVSTFLLRPSGDGPFPAVLLLHDHGAFFAIGKEKVIRPFQNDPRQQLAKDWTEKYYGGHFIGDSLAKSGYLVLAADTLGWSERGPLVYEAQQAIAANFFLLGRSLAGFTAYEDLRLAAYLQQLPESHDNKIAAIGFSMGGFRAWQLAALSENINAAAAISWMTTHAVTITPGNNQLKGQSAFWMIHPGLSAQLDYPHMAGIAAPKPMLFISGGQDKLMPTIGTLQAYEILHQLWQAHGAAEQLTTELWPEQEHVFAAPQQRRVWQWLENIFDSNCN
ncbi:MAG: dienelactone hydrolase family protein [Paraglaciecola sp.]|uniref:dienelactone hydrolase family protein n=1 Tax=Alishewanella sp. SMS8 TaxID=2994676 RepID=UPI00274196BB|nr:alpha/beta hydrolase family protein [Alishewanella sp. SMS8]MDP5131128.1 dienelactone hydrolase family protein [Paraglaciecola sp.]MDP5207188.1 dienelactone hydrolase family protein [Alishewanella sp. SMS9]MDP5458509.1 alpha/beta hydrolase family protein [Alishewanella sp. SMS8]